MTSAKSALERLQQETWEYTGVARLYTELVERLTAALNIYATPEFYEDHERLCGLRSAGCLKDRGQIARQALAGAESIAKRALGETE